MDLEKLNKEYVKIQDKIADAKKEIEKLESKKNQLLQDRRIHDGKLAEAEKNGDTNAQKTIKDEMKKIDEDLSKVKDEAKDKKDEITDLKTKIDDKLNELKQNPEMKKHIETVLSKKYQRKISKLEKEKEEIQGKKERLTEVNKLITEHPTLGNNLKGIMIATKSIKDLNNELKSLEEYDAAGNIIGYKDQARADEIKNTLLPDFEQKLKNNKDPLMAYISKNKLNITEQDIDELANTDFIVDKNGNIDFKTTMASKLASINRQAKGIDKSIAHHKAALSRQVPTTSRTTRGSGTTPTPTSPTPTQPENPKWYQFVKRFKNWNEKRKQQALPGGGTPTPPARGTSTTVNNEFKDSLKYKAVEDLVKQEQENGLKEAKKQIRESQQGR